MGIFVRETTFAATDSYPRFGISTLVSPCPRQIPLLTFLILYETDY